MECSEVLPFGNMEFHSGRLGVTGMPKARLVSGLFYAPLRANTGDDAMNHEHLQLLITTVMPYGKYKGRPIADLPGQYLNWFAREGFPSGQIGRLLALMQELDHNGLSSLLDPLRKR